jgi:hypothetical protein
MTEWTRLVDILNNNFLPRERAGDHRTTMGALIDSSCFSGSLGPHRQRIIELIERLLARTMTRASRCERTLGLPSVSGIVSILRRTRLTCDSDLPPGVAAANHLTHSYNPLRALFVLTNTGHDRAYNIGVSSYTLEGILEKATSSIPILRSLAEREEAELVGTLFHEALHSTSNNNRAWHDEWREQGRTTNSCNRSLYEDQVYLLHAACNPTTEYGLDIYGRNNRGTPVIDCPGVCESALGTRDSMSRYEQATSSSSLRGTIGPPLSGPTLNPREASMTCERIRSVNRVHRRLISEQDEIRNRHQLLMRGLPFSARDSESVELKRRYESIENLALSVFRPQADPAAVLSQFQERRTEFLEWAQESCGRNQRSASWTDFCATNQAALRSSLDILQAKVQGIIEISRTQVILGAPSISEIQEFYSLD